MYLLYIFPLSTHTYDFVVLTFLTHPRKILLVVQQIGQAKDLPGPVRNRIYFFFTRGVGELSQFGTSVITWAYLSPVTEEEKDDDKYRGVGGMRACRGNRSTPRIPARVKICPSQIQYDQTWNRTVAATGFT
jgi:hypothetical protein